jgi:DNA polymerase-3 subunit delta'
MFDKIIGNFEIKNFLKKLIEKKKVPNTLLFSGMDGIGKSLFAKEMAYHLMYPQEKYPKILKDSYKRIEKETHPDLYIYKPEGKAALHPISSVREIIKNIYLFPFESESKIFIIHDAHRMLKTSFNAFLKILEEPNFDSYLILLTSKVENIIPTIISRCSVFKFSSIVKKEMIALIESWGKTKKEAERIALFSQGSILKASQIASFVDYDDKTQILLEILSSNKISYLELSKKLNTLQKMFDVLEKDEYFKEVDFLLSQILIYLRDFYLIKNGYDDETKNIFFRDFFIENKISLKELSLQDLSLQDLQNKKYCSLEKAFDFIKEAKLGISLNIQLKTCLENLFFRLNLV